MPTVSLDYNELVEDEVRKDGKMKVTVLKDEETDAAHH